MLSIEEAERFQKTHDDNVRSLVELTNENWFSIQFMPYYYFIETIKWKVDLEEKRSKIVNERNREQESIYKNRASAQKAELKRQQKAFKYKR